MECPYFSQTTSINIREIVFHRKVLYLQTVEHNVLNPFYLLLCFREVAYSTSRVVLKLK